MEMAMVARIATVTDIAGAAAVRSSLWGAGTSETVSGERGNCICNCGWSDRHEVSAPAAAACSAPLSSSSLMAASAPSPTTRRSRRIVRYNIAERGEASCVRWSPSDAERQAQVARSALSSELPARQLAPGSILEGGRWKGGAAASSVRATSRRNAVTMAAAAAAQGIGETTEAVIAPAVNSDWFEIPSSALAQRTRHASSGGGDGDLEGWLKSSLAEIVRNLRDAPFLHFVFEPSCGNGQEKRRSIRQRVPTEFFNDPNRWVEGNAVDTGLLPDGMILVHRLEREVFANEYGNHSTDGFVVMGAGVDRMGVGVGGGGHECSEERKSECADRLGPDAGVRDGRWPPCSSRSRSTEVQCVRLPLRARINDDAEGDIGSTSTELWGLVVQGREDKRHACYILRTTSVVGESGICTRFSLVRAKCFGPSLHAQLESSWLM